jgi:outer membrane receptor for ferrienterochelin and colicins
MPHPIIASILAWVLVGPPLSAQQRDTGVVRINVEEPMGPVDGVLIRAAGRSTLTNATGNAELILPAGEQVLSLARVGYVPKRVTVVVVADSVVNVKVEMAMSDVAMDDMPMKLEDVKVSATRTERLTSETPIRVEVIDAMEVDENTLMAPSGITMLLNETPGIRVHHASPTLGTGSVRILGLPGQYTAMLADGLPLYGGASSALGPLDISPVDLQRVEIIKGAASSLYGGQALGGVINLISKPPSGRSEMLLNRRTHGVSDAATWLSRRLSSGTGISLLASGTVQSAWDMDHDGWADQARARRWGVRPRVAAVDSRGRSLFVTAGFGYDRRDGGTLGDVPPPQILPFREGLTSRRADVGATAGIPLRNAGNLALRFAASASSRERRFGSGPVENDRTSTGFLELTRSIAGAQGATVLGAALQLDDFENDLNASYDHGWLTPSIFVTSERAFGPVTVSASIRGDAHPDAGFQLTERVAALVRPAEGWTVRASAGTGFSAPTATTEETEAIGFRALREGAELKRERSLGAMLDIGGELAGAEILVTAYGSAIADAIQLVDAGDGSGEGILRNADEQTRIGGVEGAAVWRFSGGKFLATYGYMRGTRPDVASGTREPIPLLTRHRLGGDLMLERPGKYRVGIEGIWHGVQSLDDNPFRSRSKPYLYVMAIAMRQFGRLEVVVNFENLLNVRQTDTDPLVRPSPTTGGRRTTDVWAPLEGFMANAALRYRW